MAYLPRTLIILDCTTGCTGSMPRVRPEKQVVSVDVSTRSLGHAIRLSMDVLL